MRSESWRQRLDGGTPALTPSRRDQLSAVPGEPQTSHVINLSRKLPLGRKHQKDQQRPLTGPVRPKMTWGNRAPSRTRTPNPPTKSSGCRFRKLVVNCARCERFAAAAEMCGWLVLVEGVGSGARGPSLATFVGRPAVLGVEDAQRADDLGKLHDHAPCN